MNLLAVLYEADCRLVIERQDGVCYLRLSRPGAALTGVDGTAYTLHVHATTLESALDEAVRWLGAEGATYAVEQAARQTRRHRR